MSNNTTYTEKLHPSSILPEMTVSRFDGKAVVLGEAQGDFDWQLVIVYRGQHCPLCTQYLNQLETFKDELSALNVDVLAVSGDSKAQLESHLEKLDISFPTAYGLTVEQMQTLGLFISNPRSEQETDHAFPEPAVFVLNQDRQIQVIDIANNPFIRPDLSMLVKCLKWIRDPEKNYPIRGTKAFL
ncbi:redoxin domain-containing protein [Alteromonas sp. a30]|uniref:redoxin domain-containing protein n=1 Tax=Alteromonas sp. a30 TaxID=2730917 RepID=UPI00227E2A5D|nr:redoxin domain-containing protein [Alteromonas sp. a30]MCY7297238.1 redoxin domain-containing protein [Alteromonas sp. a30]